MMRLFKSTVIVASLVSLYHCNSTPSPVDLSGQWPTSTVQEQNSLRDWTRQGVIRAPAKTAFAEYLEVYATLLSPGARNAQISEQAAVRGLSQAGQGALLASEKIDAAKDYTLILAATTYHREHNDFSNQNSIWTVELITNQNTVIPVEAIRRDRRSRSVIQSEYPWVGDFAEVYTLTFKSDAPWSENLDSIQLRFSSSVGNLKLNWIDSNS